VLIEGECLVAEVLTSLTFPFLNLLVVLVPSYNVSLEICQVPDFQTVCLALNATGGILSAESMR